MRVVMMIVVAALVQYQCVAIEPTASGLNELVVMDPKTHPRGLPAAILEELDGRLSVEIPPKVHIHRYYYSGDKEIQGPILIGGPVVVVANHPRTGCRMYVDVVLPDGAPKIAYNVHGITYVYPHRRVSIHFKRFPFDTTTAVVSYHSGRGVTRRLGEAGELIADKTRQGLRQSELVQSAKESVVNTGDLAIGATQAAGSLGSRVIETANSLIQSFPGVAPLMGSQSARAEARRAAEVKSAELGNRFEQSAFVPTLR